MATNASGVAAAPFPANATAGGPYIVTAATSGLTTVNFSLTNIAGVTGQPIPALSDWALVLLGMALLLLARHRLGIAGSKSTRPTRSSERRR